MSLSALSTVLLFFHVSSRACDASLLVTNSEAGDEFPEEQAIEANGHFHGIKPAQYVVALDIKGPLRGELSVEGPHYSGQVSMTFTPVLHNVSAVYFHAVDLGFTRAVLKVLDTEYPVVVRETPSSHIKKVDLPFVLERYQPYNMAINFTGLILWKGRGIFYRYDRSANSQSREPSWALTTLFQMRHARQAFPCIDHPLMKATFQLCISYQHGGVESNVVIAGNTPATSTENSYHSMRTCFEETPLMPTYVVAFAVLGNYHVTTNESGSVPISVYYGNPLQYEYAKDVARKSVKLIKEMEEYFKLDYPLKRLSFVVHQDMPDGILGIENFGLVSLSQGIPGDHIGLRIFTHELLHQWLGNTATLKSWREVCVQEGLVTFLDFLFSNQSLGTDLHQSLFRAKSSAFTRHEQMEGRLLKPYNSIDRVVTECYARPPMIFSTIFQLAGPEEFRKFARRYMKFFKYQNADFHDVLDTLSQSVSPGVGQSLRSLYTQPGYPLLIVSHLNSTKYVEVIINATTVLDDATLTQFSHEGELPVKFYTEGNTPRPIVALARFPSTVGFELENKKAWVAVDATKMMYRVIYDTTLYERLASPCDASTSSCPSEELKRNAAKDLSWALQRRYLPFRESVQVTNNLWNIYTRLSEAV